MLYILGANHELKYGGYSASRTLLQRGLRMNPESTELWREMVRLELVLEAHTNVKSACKTFLTELAV